VTGGQRHNRAGAGARAWGGSGCSKPENADKPDPIKSGGVTKASTEYRRIYAKALYSAVSRFKRASSAKTKPTLFKASLLRMLPSSQPSDGVNRAGQLKVGPE